MKNFETIIGVEVHAELNTKRKIFSSSLNDVNSAPNTNVNEIDLGFPGALPVFNEEVLQKAIIVAHGLNMNITKEMHWDRKNYFYHDLPKGYQITQFDTPIGRNGYIKLDSGKKIGITFMHMEEDTAKTFNNGNEIKLDFNRCGVPLIEIVSDPELRDGEETKEYLEKLREILMFLKVNDGKLEEGSFRVDVNISIRPYGQKTFNTKVEIKNLNSFANIKKAIDQETSIQIQKYLFEENITQDTKRFDENSGKIITMRTKEDKNDYRYFPEPNLPEIVVEQKYIDQLLENFPMLPQQIKDKLLNDYKLPKKDINVLLTNIDMTDFYLKSLNTELDPKKTINYLLVNVNEFLNKNKIDFRNTKLTIENLVDISNLIDMGKISTNHVKKIFPYILEKEDNVLDIVKKLGLEQISNEKVIEEFVASVLEANPESISLYMSGKDKAFGYLIGQIIKLSKGQANPKIVNEVLIKKLNEIKSEKNA